MIMCLSTLHKVPMIFNGKLRKKAIQPCLIAIIGGRQIFQLSEYLRYYCMQHHYRDITVAIIARLLRNASFIVNCDIGLAVHLF